MAKTRERVQAGIAFLKEHPGTEVQNWYDVDVELLSLTSDTGCVLGQMFGSYSDATDLFVDEGWVADLPEEGRGGCDCSGCRMESWSYDHGFMTRSYEELTGTTAHWIAAIVDHREESVQ